MYLIRYNEFKTRQVRELRSDSLFYGWIYDNHIEVIRSENGQFERLVIVTEKRLGTSLRFKAEWREIPVEE